ncbi:hypothetical protein HDV63DRAFT_384751 [Trichoderma sp. SZMC 28014]
MDALSRRTAAISGNVADSVDQDTIHRVLRSKRVSRGPACIPCRHRKVKCDHSQPCRTCVRRGHSDICVYTIHEPDDRHNPSGARRSISANRTQRESSIGIRSAQVTPVISRNDGTSEAEPLAPLRIGISDSIHRQRGEVPSTVLSGASNRDSREQPYSGGTSILTELHLLDPDSFRDIAEDAAPVLGLQNTFAIDPFLDATTAQTRWAALRNIFPDKTETLTYFSLYRSSAHPFNPILFDIDHFEFDMCRYLQALDSGQLGDAKKINEQWFSNKSIAFIALLLATLASGCHFSLPQISESYERCLQLMRRTFKALQLANYLFNPSLDIIQALLILGNTLQNLGQSEGAWVILGTTVRLAQALGLHMESVRQRPGEIGRKVRAVWAATIWQDSLLSLCQGRPIIIRSHWISAVTQSTGPLTYIDIMHYLQSIVVEVMGREVESDVASITHLIQGINDCYRRGEPHLLSRDMCRNLHQHLEHLICKIHVSFNVSVLCRPVTRRSVAQRDDPLLQTLRSRIRESLMDTLKAFLDLAALSVVSLRIWTTVHNVLSCSLLLSTWDDTRDDTECQDLQQRVIDAFLSAGQSSKTAIADPSLQGNVQWLSERHARAFMAVQNALRRSSQLQRGEALAEVELPAIFNNDLNNDQTAYWEDANISPFAYVEAVINGM